MDRDGRQLGEQEGTGERGLEPRGGLLRGRWATLSGEGPSRDLLVTWQEGTASSARPRPGKNSAEPSRAGICQPLTCSRSISTHQDAGHAVRPGRPCLGSGHHSTAQEGPSGRNVARAGTGPRFWLATAHMGFPSHVPLVSGRQRRRTLGAHGLCLTRSPRRQSPDSGPMTREAWARALPCWCSVYRCVASDKSPKLSGPLASQHEGDDQTG